MGLPVNSSTRDPRAYIVVKLFYFWCPELLQHLLTSSLTFKRRAPGLVSTMPTSTRAWGGLKQGLTCLLEWTLFLFLLLSSSPPHLPNAAKSFIIEFRASSSSAKEEKTTEARKVASPLKTGSKNIVYMPSFNPNGSQAMMCSLAVEGGTLKTTQHSPPNPSCVGNERFFITGDRDPQKSHICCPWGPSEFQT